MIFENLPLFLKSRCEQSVFFRKFTDNLYRGPSRPKHSSSSSSSSSTSFFSLPREMYERKRENSRIIVHRSFFLFFSSRAIIIFRASSGFRTGQPSSSQGKYRLPPPFRRENIDIRGGFFSLNRPSPQPEFVASGPGYAERNTRGGGADDGRVTSAHRRKLERNRSAGVLRPGCS